MRSSGAKLIIGLLTALIVLYVAMQIYLVTYPSYRTEVAVLCELSDQITASGTAVRPESVSSDGSGVKYFLVADGDKVAKGEKVAEYYKDSAAAVRNMRIDELRRELDILTDLSKGNRGNTNLESIRRSVYGLLSSYSADVGHHDLTEINYVRRSLITYLSSYEISAGGTVDTSARAEAVRALISSMESSDMQPTGYVVSEESGFFVSFTDGCETTIAPEDLDGMTAEEIKAAIEKNHGNYSYNGDNYKILSDYTWYYVCVLDPQDAARLRVGRKYSADFSYSSADDLPATVEKLLPSEDGKYTVAVLSFDRMNPAAAVLRNEDVDIKFTNYRGIKVSKTALRLIDGKLGVFVKYGNMVRFKEVDIIYETEDFVLSSVTEGSSSLLSLYDEIITQGKNLYVDRDLSRS